MNKILVTILTLFFTALIVCGTIITVKTVRKYSDMLEECANMYPLHFEEMCLGK